MDTTTFLLEVLKEGGVNVTSITEDFRAVGYTNVSSEGFENRLTSSKADDYEDFAPNGKLGHFKTGFINLFATNDEGKLGLEVGITSGEGETVFLVIPQEVDGGLNYKELDNYEKEIALQFDYSSQEHSEFSSVLSQLVG